jgi:uncharacterized protein YjbI with pentapeptide repeats
MDNSKFNYCQTFKSDINIDNCQKTDFIQVKFIKSQLEGQFIDCSFRGSNFYSSNLSSATFQNCDFSAVTFLNCDNYHEDPNRAPFIAINCIIDEKNWPKDWIKDKAGNDIFPKETNKLKQLEEESA